MLPDINFYETVANLLKIRKETIRKSLEHFQGVEHRLENVLTINKVKYINDSKATNINAAYYALESMEFPDAVWRGISVYVEQYGLLQGLCWCQFGSVGAVWRCISVRSWQFWWLQRARWCESLLLQSLKSVLH